MSLGSAARCRNEGGVHSLSVENEWCVSCLLLCPVLWSVGRPIGQAILSIHRVFTYPGAKKFGRFLAIAQVARPSATPLVVKSRDFFLLARRRRLWKCGRTDGRTRSCVNSAVLHDGWESCACGVGGGGGGAFAVLSLSAKSQSHSLPHSAEGNVRPTPTARQAAVNFARAL